MNLYTLIITFHNFIDLINCIFQKLTKCYKLTYPKHSQNSKVKYIIFKFQHLLLATISNESGQLYTTKRSHMLSDTIWTHL